MWSWGANSEGQLGGGSARSQPGPVGGDLNNAPVAAIVAGLNRSLALRRDGTVWSWGWRYWLPEKVLGLPPNIVAIAALKGAYGPRDLDGDMLALAGDGSVWKWSQKRYGETMQPIPLPQMLDFHGVTWIGAGGNYYLAIKTDGGATPALWAWGANSSGQLGDGTFETRPAPIAVAGFSDLLGADGGYFHTVGLKSDGRVWSWGNGNAFSYPERAYPGRLVGPRDAVAVSAGSGFSLAVRRDGTVWAWGTNTYGQLGNGSLQTSSNIPVQVTGLVLSDTSAPDGDPDGDGLSTRRELDLGTDPLNPDTNGDGISDGSAVASGLSATNPDMDGDGVANALERQRGSDPFMADTDGDGCLDGVDAFPLDPNRCAAPPGDPTDQTPPVITLTEPTTAVPVP